MLQYAFFLRVNRGNPTGSSSSSPKQIQVVPMQEFASDYYYAWFYEGSQWRTYMGAVALVAVVLAGVMFPLWPMKLRIGAWYLSMGGFGLIGLFIALSIFRLIFYVITLVVASPGIWIFPKLFADVGFVSDRMVSGAGLRLPFPLLRLIHSFPVGTGTFHRQKRRRRRNAAKAKRRRRNASKWENPIPPTVPVPLLKRRRLVPGLRRFPTTTTKTTHH